MGNRGEIVHTQIEDDDQSFVQLMYEKDAEMAAVFMDRRLYTQRILMEF